MGVSHSLFESGSTEGRVGRVLFRTNLPRLPHNLEPLVTDIHTHLIEGSPPSESRPEEPRSRPILKRFASSLPHEVEVSPCRPHLRISVVTLHLSSLPFPSPVVHLFLLPLSSPSDLGLVLPRGYDPSL